MELCLRPGGWLSALARLFAAEDPAPQSRAQARPEVNARAEKLLDAYGDLLRVGADRRLRLPGAGREGQQHACGQYECKILFHDKFPPVVGSTVQFGKQIRREIFRQVKI